MRSVSKRVGQMTVVLVVSSLLVAQGAFASARQDDRGGLHDGLARIKQVVVKILGEFSWPPG